MKVLLTGATGFIGSRLRTALLARGHEVLAVARRPPAQTHAREHWLAMDFAQVGPTQWRPHLAGVDVVVNAVGILREHGSQTFAALHVKAPRALFAACADAGVPRIVQLSALGANAGASSLYHRSKKAADDYLLSLQMDALVVQPSLVFGADGASSHAFLMLASLPVLPLPSDGRQRLQPVHVDDVLEALCALVETPASGFGGQRVELVGPEPLTLADYLQALRRGLGLRPARTWPVPAWAVSIAARLGDRLPRSLLDSASWRMLERGNVASPERITQLLGRAPRDVESFVPADQATALRTQAQLAWLLPLLRLSIALVWIVTAIVSVGVFPVQESYALLARTGVPSPLQPFALYGAAALDLLLGILTLALPRSRRRPLWLSQAALMLGYMLVIAWKLPEFWLHPYGPLLKNLPMLAALALLYTLDKED